MPVSTHLGLPFLEAGQAQKHVTLNEALRALDAITQLAVAGVSDTPPGSPAEGLRYIVGTSPEGAFATHANKVAAFQDGAWRFFTPREGWRAWDAEASVLRIWSEGAWIEFTSGGAEGGVFDPEDVDYLYINGADPAEASVKLAVRANDVLLHALEAAASGTGDMRLQLSKEAAGDTASVYFSRAFSGRAEFGLVESDDFKLKVSADGSSWTEELQIDRSTGRLRMPPALSLSDPDQVVARRHVRELLTANRTYYVRTDGSDSNTGLANTSGGAFQTIQKAWNTIVTLDLNGNSVTIQLADGTYTAGLSATVAPLGGNVTINGNASTPTNVVISAQRCIDVSCAATVTVRNMRLTGSISGVHAGHPAAQLNMGVGLSFSGVVASEGHIAIRAGLINAMNSFTIGASANSWLFMLGGKFSCGDITITFSGTPAWSSYGIGLNILSSVILYNVTMSGSATGKRYQVEAGSILNSFGAGSASTYFPGSTNGSTSTGGQQL